MGALSSSPPAEPAGLAAGQSFFQVLEPSKILGPGGALQYAMVGPFADLASANAYAVQRPASFITVTLVLHQMPATPASSNPAR